MLAHHCYTNMEGGVQPVVPSPANTTNCASLASLASVFSDSGSELFKMPSKMVLLTRSGFGELLISRTLSIHHYRTSSAPKYWSAGNQTYRLLVNKLSQGGTQRPDKPCRRRLDKASIPRKVTEDVGEREEEIGCFKVQLAVVRCVHEMERVAKRVLGDHVARVRFEYVVHLHNLARPAGYFYS